MTEAHEIANILKMIDKLVTKDDLRVAVSGLRAEMASKEDLASLEKGMMRYMNGQLYKFAFFIVLTTVTLTEGLRAF